MVPWLPLMLLSAYFAAEVKGAMYLQVLNKEATTLECNRSFAENLGSIFYENGKYSVQLTKRGSQETCNENNSIPVNVAGLFACHSLTDTCESFNTSVKIISICEYDFFIVTHAHQSQGSKATELYSWTSTEQLTKKPENTDVRLSCTFNASGIFILQWVTSAGQIKGETNVTCLYSIAKEDYAFIFNEHCCVDSKQTERIHNDSTLEYTSKNQTHDIKIKNITSSDSGNYLCVVAFLENETYRWHILKNISLHVEKYSANTSNLIVYVISAGILALITGFIIFLLLWIRRKSKGNIVAESSRNTDQNGTPENYECEPYAVGKRDTKNSGTEPYYSSVKKPCAPEYSLLEASPATAPEHGPDISTVYALAQRET
ncbi:uncharacterized protein [Ambystoma mexicanum]|uniref:uncharacterized protein isoform X2 n=1 Tax=Ambystoma mexicanum TaxID=8296 RepID=UPI0037E9A75B